VLDQLSLLLAHPVQKIRVHGDYHLGQLLVQHPTPALSADSAGPQLTSNHSSVAKLFVVDFEGEPARPLLERREKDCALKDVAGMLRSFSYAAAFAARADHVERTPDRPENGELRRWEEQARLEFLQAYRSELGGTSLIPPPETFDRVLAAFELEKALYELVYEMNNRPAWVEIPARGIAHLLDR
jgi:maltose alpha-D-glucosyltransferase/alpha-amylase